MTGPTAVEPGDDESIINSVTAAKLASFNGCSSHQCDRENLLMDDWMTMDVHIVIQKRTSKIKFVWLSGCAF